MDWASARDRAGARERENAKSQSWRAKAEQRRLSKHKQQLARIKERMVQVGCEMNSTGWLRRQRVKRRGGASILGKDLGGFDRRDCAGGRTGGVGGARGLLDLKSLRLVAAYRRVSVLAPVCRYAQAVRERTSCGRKVCIVVLAC